MKLKKIGYNYKNFYKGQKILIICYSGIQKETVKKVIPMRRFVDKKWSKPYDYEILLDKKNNRYFSLEMLRLQSSWVFSVYERVGK